MKFKANCFVLSKSESKSKDGKTTYYNGSVQFDGDDFSQRVSIDKDIYDILEPHASYEDAEFEYRKGVSKAGNSYEMYIMKSVGA